MSFFRQKKQKNRRKSSQNYTLLNKKSRFLDEFSVLSKGWAYVQRGEITKGKDYVDKYKIIIGRFVPSNGELNVKPGEGYRVLTEPKILSAGEINTETYIDTAIFDTIKPW